jgi:hypothetical protein
METNVLSRDELRRRAPSIFAEAPHNSRSERYGFIPTISVLDALMKEGFVVRDASQSAIRGEDTDGRAAYTKHMVRLQRPADAARVEARIKRGVHRFISDGPVFPELVLTNAHDGSARYKLMAGLFRLACENGLVVADGMIATLSVMHSGDVIRECIEGTRTVLEQTNLAVDAMAAWRQIDLAPREQMAFAEAARVARFADADGEVKTPIKAGQLLEARRVADGGNGAQARDLWRTFNVVQENAIRGGLQGERVNPDTGKKRRTKTRPIGGIDQNVSLNKALWTLATELAKAKGA